MVKGCQLEIDMPDDPLKIVDVQKGLPHSTKSASGGRHTRATRDQEARAIFERRWLREPKKFDPARSAREQQRISRTWHLLKPLIKDSELTAIDLGFGWGVLTRQMRNEGAVVHALDIAENALKHFRDMGESNVTLIREALPMTTLPDGAYDIAVCTDVVAELHSNDQRLLMSELYRILKPEGRLVMSTSLDYRTDGALERFAQLVDTEFEVLEWEVSHHAYLLGLLHRLGGPERYVRASNDAAYYQELRASRGALRRGWLMLMISPPCVWAWKGLSFLAAPLRKHLSHSRRIMCLFEAICRAISPDRGITHAICTAKLKSLNTTEPVDVQKMEPQNQRLRQRVWE